MAKKTALMARKSWLQKLRDQLKYQPSPLRPASPRLIGCLNCSPVPSPILRQSDALYAWWATIIEQRSIPVECKERHETPQVGLLAKQHCTNPHSTYLLRVVTPLHEEVYQWDLARGRWVLVGQGLGCA